MSGDRVIWNPVGRGRRTGADGPPRQYSSNCIAHRTGRSSPPRVFCWRASASGYGDDRLSHHCAARSRPDSESPLTPWFAVEPSVQHLCVCFWCRHKPAMCYRPRSFFRGSRAAGSAAVREAVAEAAVAQVASSRGMAWGVTGLRRDSFCPFRLVRMGLQPGGARMVQKTCRYFSLFEPGVSSLCGAHRAVYSVRSTRCSSDE